MIASVEPRQSSRAGERGRALSIDASRTAGFVDDARRAIDASETGGTYPSNDRSNDGTIDRWMDKPPSSRSSIHPSVTTGPRDRRRIVVIASSSLARSRARK